MIALKKKLKYKFKVIICIFLILNLCIHYFCIYDKNKKFINNYNYNDSYNISIKSDLKITNKYIKFNGLIEKNKVSLIYFINNNIDVDKLIKNKSISYNNIYTVHLSKVNFIRNNYDNDNSFNYQKMELSKNIVVSAQIKSIDKISKKNNFVCILRDFRLNKILSNIKKYPNISAYINALSFGYNNIDSDIYQMYNNLSLVHMFAISGTHIIIIIIIINYLLSLLLLSQNNISKILIFLLIIYCILTDFSPSVIRAVSMVILSIIFKNKLTSMSIYLIVLILNLIINPFIMLNVGFELSYIITFILIFFSKRIGNINNKLIRSLYIQFLINLIIFPIINNLNNSINIFSYIANIILVPIISFILLPLSFILTIINIKIVVYIYTFIIKYTERLTSILNNFTYNIGHINMLIMYIYILLIIYILINYSKFKVIEKKVIYILVTIILLNCININIMGSVNIIDVSQGDSILIRLPFNKGNILIDLGDENGTHEVLRQLKYYGINKIDILIITHMHSDHVGDIEYLSRNIKIKNLIISKFNNSLKTNINTLKVSAGDKLSFKDYSIFFLGPYKSYPDNLNNQSVVFKIKLGRKNWMFTGDQEKEEEEETLEKFNKKFLNIDYLKSGHHGSKTSSSIEYIKAITPEKSFISVGKNNRYGLPNDEIIDEYEKQGIKIYRTDEIGEIKIYFI